METWRPGYVLQVAAQERRYTALNVLAGKVGRRPYSTAYYNLDSVRGPHLRTGRTNNMNNGR